MTMVSRFSHPAKANSPMEETVSGKVMVSTDFLPKKTPFAIVSIPWGMVTCFLLPLYLVRVVPSQTNMGEVGIGYTAKCISKRLYLRNKSLEVNTITSDVPFPNLHLLDSPSITKIQQVKSSQMVEYFI